MRKEKDKDELTIYDRIGFAIAAPVIVGLGILISIWLPAIVFFRFGEEPAAIIGFVFLFFLEHFWVFVLGACILGFLTGDRYINFVLEPFLRLLNWMMRDAPK